MYWEMGAHGRKKKLTAPESVVAIECRDTVAGKTEYKWEKNDLTMLYWLKHLQDIFNYPKIDFIRFVTNSFQFDIDDIKEIFGNTLKIIIGDTGCHVFNQMILERFSPIERLKIMTSDFPNSNVPERILMQNFDGLEIGDMWMETTIMSLDQLLLINSGIDIIRVDGVKATIQFKNDHPLPSLEMFVWFDHCIVES
ncbi:hypothetical protein CAEBREN_21487 [Caenorhabditis brenneri]|uniref:Sdz-33 F-box domain-containing protein n=1 Tax=Caenorhabditis brenneri TaxID=135651 RepID=G0N0H7_CAEBE|nr:hypothetical protein CAEBREN_21487 [Caenorhabditis brenneri]